MPQQIGRRETTGERDGGEDRGGGGGGNQPGGMETLSKVNEQKDNVLAPNTTLSLSGTVARGIIERVGCQDSEVHECVCVFGSKHMSACELLCMICLHLRNLLDYLIRADLKRIKSP